MKAHRLSFVDEVARLVNVRYRFDLAVGEDCIKITGWHWNSINPSALLFTGED